MMKKLIFTIIILQGIFISVSAQVINSRTPFVIDTASKFNNNKFFGNTQLQPYQRDSMRMITPLSNAVRTLNQTGNATTPLNSVPTTQSNNTYSPLGHNSLLFPSTTTSKNTLLHSSPSPRYTPATKSSLSNNLYLQKH